MGDTPDDHTDQPPLTERFLDLFVFLPTGLAVTVAEELPRLAERGRERLGVQVNSARAVGHLVVKTGHTLTEDEVLAHAAQQLAPFKCPKAIVFVDSLPKNPSGKLLKRELRQRLQAHFGAG